ncbi:MAG: hypothetical protein FJ295_12005 [Planctomycetes bacterium]|nr:hypothetical protein [Planctomycetota bacterium]
MIAQRTWFSAAPRFPWPVHWKAWAYFAGWGAFLALPWTILVARQHFPESLVWPWAVAGLMFWDLRSAFRGVAPTPIAGTSTGRPAADNCPTFPTAGTTPDHEIQFLETPRFVVQSR